MTISAHAVLRRGLFAASQSAALRHGAERYGRRLGARRFVAGETLDELVAVVRRLEREGFRATATLLGEAVRDPDAVERAVAAHRRLLARIAAEDLGCGVSIKLTNLGLAIDAERAGAHAADLVAEAARRETFVRIDMEESAYVDATLGIYRALRAAGATNVGVVLQAYLRRTAADLDALLPLRPNVRIVKGAYLEPESVAYPDKATVDERYLQLIEAALPAAGFTAIATHDERAIAHALAVARRHGLEPGRHFELQMLYGVRPGLQRRLVADGYPVRLFVPYGAEWFPYFMRRLAERPANLWFLLRNLAQP